MNKHYLWQKLGKQIQAALNNDRVDEIILNPDQSLWISERHNGCYPVGKFDQQESLNLVNAIARFNEQCINDSKPYLDCTLPYNNERVCITIPPITDAASFNIRKHHSHVFTLMDYVEQGVLTQQQAQCLATAIAERKNILVSGGPGSGKTTLTNALLDEMANSVPSGHRILLLEQIPELQCRVENYKRLITSEHVNLRTLLWLAMRNSPDRIIVGEVRDGAALDCLKAWNTGCPGGIATIHANSPEAAMQRVIDLSLEAINIPPYSLAAEAIDYVVQLNRDNTLAAGRRVSGIVAVTGYRDSEFQWESVAC